jgi:hypothetical protein
MNQWLIKWVNLPEAAATWEDVDFMSRVFPDLKRGGGGALSAPLLTEAMLRSLLLIWCQGLEKIDD